MPTDFENSLDHNTVYICGDKVTKMIKTKKLSKDNEIVVVYEPYTGKRPPINGDDFTILYQEAFSSHCSKLKFIEEEINELKLKIKELKQLRTTVNKSHSTLKNKLKRLALSNAFNNETCEDKTSGRKLLFNKFGMKLTPMGKMLFGMSKKKKKQNDDSSDDSHSDSEIEDEKELIDTSTFPKIEIEQIAGKSKK